jgi:Flp pilus assembly protein TadB
MHGMRYGWARWPLWARGVAVGVGFGGAMTVYAAVFRSTPWWLALLIDGVLGGALFGVLFPVFLARLERRAYGDGSLTGEQRVAVHEAIQDATPPTDPRLRAAADRIARRSAGRGNSPLLFVGATVVCLGVAAALIAGGHRAGWALGVVWVVCGPLFIWASVRQQRRARRYLAAG